MLKTVDITEWIEDVSILDIDVNKDSFSCSYIKKEPEGYYIFAYFGEYRFRSKGYVDLDSCKEARKAFLSHLNVEEK